MKSFSKRECLMLAGMFLSKFNREGLQHLGFSSFWEAYNAIGYLLMIPHLSYQPMAIGIQMRPMA